MSETQQPSGTATISDVGKSSRIVNFIFKFIFRGIYLLTLLIMVYWFVASDRFVSESVVMVQNTDTAGSGQPTDILNMVIGTTGNKGDQLVLIEYLTSLDMLKKLDAEFDLRSHYSSTEHDIVSRLWDKDISIEWFYRYYLNRVTVIFDEYSGVIKIQAQAFTPEMAQNITSFLVREGEAFMNEMSHSIANEQVVFLEKQVDLAREDVKEASQKLLKFQNQKNIASPTVEIANYQNLIADLEKQKSEPVEAKKEEVREEKKEDSYISSLIDDLKNKMDKEEDLKKKQEEEFKEVYDKIHAAYPYLSNGFIRSVYDLKETIAREYPLNEKIIILHRTSFNNVENLRQYVEITLKHGYMINADEKKMIVDAFRQHINTDGKIITSIFEVANQSALLSGEYEGYRVLFEDDL